MASDYRKSRPTAPVVDVGAVVRKSVIDKTTHKINAKIDAKIDKQVAKVAAKTARHVETLDRLAAHLETIDVWTRSDRGSRKPRFNRDDIAAAAIRIADAEGFEAVSMRRLAVEMDAGTMSLYHYVRTKDELLTLVFDALMGELVVPHTQRMPREWRAAITLVAKRSRDALRRHPWILDITDVPSIGPNAMRHFDQSWQALSSLDATFEEKLDLITVVDEYVFGYCLHERNNLNDNPNDAEMVDYIGTLLNDNEYPALAAMVAEMGMPRLWSRIHSHSHGAGRFDRNLARLLAGFEASLGSDQP
ncbi:MAG: TetR/AcrR family transcriptional regulator C-terminal domain-containing protein [Ilumatobacteraceae bacterium]